MLSFPQEDIWLFGIVFLCRQEWEKDEPDGLFRTFPQYTQALLVLLLLILLFFLFFSILRFFSHLKIIQKNTHIIFKKRSERYG